MKKAITYQEALDQRNVKENDYFLIKYPGGWKVLFRLVKAYSGLYVMWGPPTTEKILLKGKKGYRNLFTLADELARKQYYCESTFEEVHACGLPEKEYKVLSWKKLNCILNDVASRFAYPNDLKMRYVLASRCIDIGSNGKYFRVFVVSNGIVSTNTLHYSLFETISWTHAVRPEATPKPTLLLEMEGHDGSRANPWICLGS